MNNVINLIRKSIDPYYQVKTRKEKIYLVIAALYTLIAIIAIYTLILFKINLVINEPISPDYFDFCYQYYQIILYALKIIMIFAFIHYTPPILIYIYQTKKDKERFLADKTIRFSSFISIACVLPVIGAICIYIVCFFLFVFFIVSVGLLYYGAYYVLCKIAITFYHIQITYNMFFITNDNAIINLLKYKYYAICFAFSPLALYVIAMIVSKIFSFLFKLLLGSDAPTENYDLNDGLVGLIKFIVKPIKLLCIKIINTPILIIIPNLLIVIQSFIPLPDSNFFSNLLANDNIELYLAAQVVALTITQIISIKHKNKKQQLYSKFFMPIVEELKDIQLTLLRNKNSFNNPEVKNIKLIVYPYVKSFLDEMKKSQKKYRTHSQLLELERNIYTVYYQNSKDVECLYSSLCEIIALSNKFDK